MPPHENLDLFLFAMKIAGAFFENNKILIAALVA